MRPDDGPNVGEYVRARALEDTCNQTSTLDGCIGLMQHQIVAPRQELFMIVCLYINNHQQIAKCRCWWCPAYLSVQLIPLGTASVLCSAISVLGGWYVAMAACSAALRR